MKLAHLCFDDMVPVYGYSTALGGVAWHRSNTFAAEDGWDLHHLGQGHFSLQHATMAAPAFVGGYGYSYTAYEAPVVPMPETNPRRKRGG